MLNVNDMFSLQVVIEMATKRGAFNASEMKEVGELYNRLVETNKTLAEHVKREENENNTVHKENNISKD